MSEEVQKQDWNEIFRKAGKRALGGGIAGSAAMVVNILSLMWLRTTMNYQYRNGTNTIETMKILMKQGGIPRFYKGLAPALLQGPLSRFGDTAANAGMIELLNSNEKTKNLPVGVKTFCASVAAASWRIFLMPIDTCKTYLQVEGSFGSLIAKVRASGPGVLYHGAVGAFSATWAGHFPWFFVNNLMSEKLRQTNDPFMKFCRRAFIGFCSSVVSDSISNSIRVCKVYKQSSTTATTYPKIIRGIVAEEGVLGLLGRGLGTRIISNGAQGIMFNVLWKYAMDQINKIKKEDEL